MRFRNTAAQTDWRKIVRVNDDFLRLQKNHLLVEVAKRVKCYKEEHPDASIIRLGIGDVTQPLAPAVIQALHEAVDEQTSWGYRENCHDAMAS